MSDVDPPMAYWPEERTAVKVHRCCECGRDIERGEKYHRVSGVWDNYLSYYKTCKECHDIGDWCRLFFTDWCPIFGNMYSDLMEYAEGVNMLATTIPHKQKVIYRIT